MHPALLPVDMLQGRAFDMIRVTKTYDGATLAGDHMICVEDLPAFLLLVCGFHVFLVVFPILALETPEKEVSVNNFYKICDCMLFESGLDLLAEYESLKIQGVGPSFDAVVAWYTGLVRPDLKSRIKLGDNKEPVEEEVIVPVFLEQVPHVDKKTQKRLLKHFSTIQKEILNVVSNTTSLEHEFQKADSNGNSILSLEEFMKYLNVHISPTLCNLAAAGRAIYTCTGRNPIVTTSNDDTNDNTEYSLISDEDWFAQREFGNILILTFIYHKVFAALQMPQHAQIGNPVNIFDHHFHDILRLIGVKISTGESQALYNQLKQKRLRLAPELHKGCHPDSVTIDELCIWFAFQIWPSLFEGNKQSKKKAKKQNSRKGKSSTPTEVLEEFLVLEGAILDMAKQRPDDVHHLWLQLAGNEDSENASIFAFLEFLPKMFPLLSNEGTILHTYANTTGRESGENSFILRKEFVPLIVNCFYFHRIDFEFTRGNGSMFSGNAPDVTISEARNCLLRMGNPYSEEELMDIFNAVKVTDSFALPDLALWYAELKCPQGGAVFSESSALNDEQVAFVNLIDKPDRFKARMINFCGGHYEDGWEIVQLDSFLRSQFPNLLWSPEVITEAFTRSTGKTCAMLTGTTGNLKGVDGDSMIPSKDVRTYLTYLLYFEFLKQQLPEAALYGFANFVEFRLLAQAANIEIEDDKLAKVFRNLCQEGKQSHEEAKKEVVAFYSCCQFICNNMLH
eukprot:m.127496 g.127496  ORF g.127496 m.127496 type:complete len:735 (-) comp14548_c0_seq1:8289-10493(-)